MLICKQFNDAKQYSSYFFSSFQVNVLSSMGGHSIVDTMRRMLYKIGTPKVWSHYNLKGRGNKEAISSVNLSK